MKKRNTQKFTGTLGRGHWVNFMKKNKRKIIEKRGKKYHLVWMNRCGEECDKSEVFGYKVHHQIIRPELYFCAD